MLIRTVPYSHFRIQRFLCEHCGKIQRYTIWKIRGNIDFYDMFLQSYNNGLIHIFDDFVIHLKISCYEHS